MPLTWPQWDRSRGGVAIEALKEGLEEEKTHRGIYY